MGVLPAQIHQILRLYSKLSRVLMIPNSSAHNAGAPGEIISISAEAKRTQVMEQIKQRVLKKIKETAKE